MPPNAVTLLAWYDTHRRQMPWRAPPGHTAEPYHVWLSEIMLQQTNVTTVTPYFNKFLARFRTVQALAAAPENDILAAWAGLGYYARARNLHACARAVTASGGGFPDTVPDLRALPGIGPYTAAAIAAIAFGVPVIPVDGNVERITARLFAIAMPIPGAKPAIAAAAATLNAAPEARARASDFAQALFDLGATICTPRPACALCPLAAGCEARRQGIAETLPRRAARPVRPTRHGAQFWLTDAAGHVMLRRRPPRGLLGGMTELPGTEWRAAPWPRAEALAESPAPAAWRLAGQVRHVFTHFELFLNVYAASVESLPEGAVHRARDALDAEALPSVMRKCVAVAIACG